MKAPSPAVHGVVASRRAFLKTTAALAGASALGAIPLERAVHAAGSGKIRIGLIGCGGRGTAAALNAMNAGPDISLVALADIFQDKLQSGLEKLKERKRAQVAVTPDKCFVGFDAYRQLIDSGVDAVLIAPASHFIPLHLRAAVEAGKHVFCEKPHGIDIPGVNACMASGKRAETRKLSLVSGLCWRYDTGVRETMQRVLDGAIGEILAIQETYVSYPYYAVDRRPDWNEMEFQMRDWYHFNWLSGDQTAQQLIHSLDKASWALQDQPPVRVWGLGGRQTCVETKYGDQFDHQAVVFEYPDGVRVFGYTRDQTECYADTSDYIIGSEGKCDLLKHRITGRKSWAFEGKKASMYDLEHEALFDSIRAGKPLNNTHYMCLSSKLAIAAQIAIYSGQAITWQQVERSRRSFALERYGWDVSPPVLPRPDGTYAAPMQGKAELARWRVD